MKGGKLTFLQFRMHRSPPNSIHCWFSDLDVVAVVAGFTLVVVAGDTVVVVVVVVVSVELLSEDFQQKEDPY